MSTGTIYQAFQRTVEQFGSRPAYGWKQGKERTQITWQQAWDRVQALAAAMRNAGMVKGSRVVILSENRVEWALIDLATHTLGGVTVAIYPTLPADQVKFLLQDSKASFAFVSTAEQAEKVLPYRPELPDLKQVIGLEEGIQGVDASYGGFAAGSPLPAGETITPDTVEGDLATIIYTSGTTGNPKGAMLSHANLLHVASVARQFATLDENDLFLSFLPLCHVVERVGGYYLPLWVGAQVVYSEGVFTLGKEFSEVQPTAFLSVPRVYESMHEKMVERVGKLEGLQGKIARWAVDAGVSRTRAEAAGGAGMIATLKHAVASKLALHKLQTKATGGRLRLLVSGGAPLNPATFQFFQAIGLEILEGYGLTEFPVIAINRPGRSRSGTVGEAVPGNEIKIANDGEILAKGPGCMSGYYYLEEATGQSIDEKGWFHTGDIGELTPDGRLRITDRKKDIIVLANGKNVAPQPIEARFKESPYIAECVLLGDKQATLSALIVPQFDRLRAWAKENGQSEDPVELIKSPALKKLIRGEIDARSGSLADFERVKKIALIDHQFSIEGGELTPTLKVKRKVVSERFGQLIYGE